jgi:hypothetical protein
MLRRSALLLLAFAALLAAAPVAQAADKDVFREWTRENTTWSKLEDALGKNLNTWTNSGYKKGDPALQRISKIRTLIARRKKAVLAEESSSDDGANGKSLALANLRDYNDGLIKLRKAVYVGMDGHINSANSYLKQYDALIARAGRYEKRAHKAFQDAGVE